MAIQGVQFDLPGAKRIVAAVRRVEGTPRNQRGRGRRWPAGDDNTPDSDAANPNTGSGSCACCDPSNCVEYPRRLHGCDACSTGPRNWQVDLGGIASIYAPTMPTEFELVSDGYCVYLSPTFAINGLAAIGGCAASPGDCCTGDTTYTMTGGVWVETSNDCSEGCSTVLPPQCTSADFDGLPWDEGDTVTRPCVGALFDRYEFQSGIWTSLGPGNTGCGTTDAPTVQMDNSCNGEHYDMPCCVSASGIAGDTYAYLELSISNTRDTENRNETTLSIMIDGIAAVTWVMPIGKDWCCVCENKMELKCCGPWGFSGIPETVCVAPEDYDTDDTWIEVGSAGGPAGFGCACETADGLLPRRFIMTISGSSTPPADLLACAEGLICDIEPTPPCCCDFINGTYLIEWSASDNGWVYTFLDESNTLVDVYNTCVCQVNDGGPGPGANFHVAPHRIVFGGGGACGFYIDKCSEFTSQTGCIGMLATCGNYPPGSNNFLNCAVSEDCVDFLSPITFSCVSLPQICENATITLTPITS